MKLAIIAPVKPVQLKDSSVMDAADTPAEVVGKAGVLQFLRKHKNINSNGAASASVSLSVKMRHQTDVGAIYSMPIRSGKECFCTPFAAACA
jgi:hypothetical protein